MWDLNERKKRRLSEAMAEKKKHTDAKFIPFLFVFLFLFSLVAVLSLHFLIHPHIPNIYVLCILLYIFIFHSPSLPLKPSHPSPLLRRRCCPRRQLSARLRHRRPRCRQPPTPTPTPTPALSAVSALVPAFRPLSCPDSLPMVALIIQPYRGNVNTRHFPHSGYLALTPVKVDGGQSFSCGSLHNHF